MARKNLFEPSPGIGGHVDEVNRSPLAKTRPLLSIDRPLRPASPLGAISQSLDSINSKVKHAEEIEQKLAEGLSVVELDPYVIDDSFIADRMGFSPEDHSRLVESIREHGQQVPILVRPRPDDPGRYQVAYGRRRLVAVKELGRKIRAVVRDLNDEQLVVAQGQENSARTDLTFIERARFATRLEERKFTREIIMAALSVDKAALSRMISIASRVPPDLIEAIGPAPAYGRQRWQEFMELIDASENRDHLRNLIKKSEFLSLASDQKFDTLYHALKVRALRARAEPWVSNDGAHVAKITRTERRLTFMFDRKVVPGFADFVQSRLQQLYDEFKAVAKNE
jgi:ParB family transcriptional regulator, chromosome partitioning protein